MTDFEAITVQSIAGEAYDCFETSTRDNGDRFTILRDGAPEWVRDLVWAGHGDGALLPDDWRYDCIQSACGFIHDNNADEDSSYEFADQSVDIYNSARYQWLTSNLNRASYVDEATAEFGPADDVTEAIGRGQYMEASEVYASVFESLSLRLEELEDNDS